MVEEVDWSGGWSSTAAETAAGGKCIFATYRGQSDARQDHATGCAHKKILKPPRYRQAVEYLGSNCRIRERRACRITRLNRGTYRYRSQKDSRTALRTRILEITQAGVRYGYRKILVLLKREECKIEKTPLHGLYQEEGLGFR